MLSFVTFEYNTAVRTARGFSSVDLLHRSEDLGFIYQVLPYTDYEGPDERFINFTSGLQEWSHIAGLCSFSQQQGPKLRYDERHMHNVYHSGHLVWVSVPLRKLGSA